MLYIIVASILVITIILYLRDSHKKKAEKTIEKIRMEWGKPKKGPLHFDNISRYAEIFTTREFHQLSVQTIRDIDFYDLFAFIDRTTSKIGQQFLFKRMLHPTNLVDEALEKKVDLFARHRELREQVQIELLKLNSSGTYHILSFLENKFLERPNWFSLSIISVVALVIMLLMSFSYPVLLIFAIIPITVNMLIHYWNRINALWFAASFSQLNFLIDVSSTIESKDVC